MMLNISLIYFFIVLSMTMGMVEENF